MTLRKINFDNSVKYIGKDRTSQSDFNQRLLNFLKKQNKKFSQTYKNFVKGIITGEGFRMIK